MIQTLMEFYVFQDYVMLENIDFQIIFKSFLNKCDNSFVCSYNSSYTVSINILMSKTTSSLRVAFDPITLI